MRKKWNIPSVTTLNASAVKSGATTMTARFECYQNVYASCSVYISPNSMYYCPGYTGVVNGIGVASDICGLDFVATEAATGSGPFCQAFVNNGTCS